MNAPTITYGRGRRLPANGYGKPGNPDRDSATATRKPAGARWRFWVTREDGSSFCYGYAIGSGNDPDAIETRDKFLHESVVAPPERKRAEWCGKGAE